MKHFWSILFLTVCFFPSTARAQSFMDAVKKIEGRFEPADAKPGQTVVFKLSISLNEGWYTYPTEQPDARLKAMVNTIILPPPGDVIFVEPVSDPPGQQTGFDAEIGDKRYYPDPVTWEFPVVVSRKATPGLKKITLEKVRVLVCVKKKLPDGTYEEKCLAPRTVPVTADLNVLEGPAVPIDPKFVKAVEKALNAPPEVKKNDPMTPSKEDEPAKSNSISEGEKPLRILRDRDYAFDIKTVEGMLPHDMKGKFSNPEGGDAGFVTFLITAMFWGAVTLLTPCVFPMVPITVSFFLKQGEKKLHNPLTMATVYTLTIVVVLGVAALFFLSVFRELSVNPWMNVALAVLFVFFALSLFGMYDIVLPNFLVRFTSKREGSGGYGGVIFMALSFSIVSFTCVAPFLGGFAGMAASGAFSKLQLAAGAFAFAAAFAAPFFVLAIFPSLIKKLPKSGGWMNTIKVVMGFLELAAALKFFRTAELRWSIPTTIFTYDFVLSMWVVILILAGLYLLNLYRLPHDEMQEHIGVPRMLFGLLSITVGIYLIPGMFSSGHERQRPAGTIYAWVDAFLLPEPGNDLEWSSDLLSTIERARERGETVLIDFTGVTCTNCRLNEKNVFPRPEIHLLLKKYLRVQMYADTIPPESYEAAPGKKKRDSDAEANLNLQQEIFGNEQLPYYVILRPVPGPKGGPVEIVGVYEEGKINNIERFKQFLQNGLKK